MVFKTQKGAIVHRGASDDQANVFDHDGQI